MSLGHARNDVTGTEEGHEYQQTGDWIPVDELGRHFGPDRKPTGGVIITVKPDPNTSVKYVLDSTAAVLVGRMAALGWEKLGGEPPKLCSECRKSRGIPGPGFIHIGLVCSEVRVKFESESVSNFANCAEVNTDGRCVMFEPRPPVANRVPVAEWDAKLKELNELGRARKPWWKFW